MKKAFLNHRCVIQVHLFSLVFHCNLVQPEGHVERFEMPFFYYFRITSIGGPLGQEV